MAVMKKSVRKKLSKYLERLIKKHGPEMTLALVTGIVSSIAADDKAKADRAKARKAAKEGKRAKDGKTAKADKVKPEKVAKPEKVDKAEPEDLGRKAAKAAAKPIVVGKRTER